MRRCVDKLLIGILLLSMAQSPVFAMSSTNYQINWDNINSGGLDSSSSANYFLQDTVGDTATGWSSSDNYQLGVAGYRQYDVDPLIFDLNVYAQANETEVSYTAFSDGGLTVTVVDSSAYATDDYIAVVEDKGGSQSVAIGQITNIALNVITVDKWDGDNGVMAGVPGGGDDVVYNLSSSLVEMDILNTVSVSTGVSAIEVTTNFLPGYDCYVIEDTDFQTSTGNNIADVLDGTVTAGSEEYGIETIGDDASQVGDVRINGRTSIATGLSAVTEKRTGIIHKAAIDANTTGGTFRHELTYTCVVKM